MLKLNKYTILELSTRETADIVGATGFNSCVLKPVDPKPVDVSKMGLCPSEIRTVCTQPRSALAC